MKKLVSGLLAVSMAAMMVGCGGKTASSNANTAAGGDAAAASGDSYTIRVAHVTGNGSPFDYGAQKFKELVEEKSGGRVKVNVYAGSMTTDDVEGVEMVQNGNLEIFWASTGSLSGFVPDLGIFELPFLFDDLDHVEKALAGDFGQKILGEVSGVDGLEALAFHEDGWRNILTKDKPVNTVDDMKGLRMRSMMNATCIAMYEALGANPISLASGEIYTSIQNSVVDGEDNSAIYAKADGYIEAVNCICDIHHFYSSGIVISNDSWFSKLSSEDQAMIKDAAEEAGKEQRAWFLDADEKLISEYEEKGYTVTRPTDIDAWKARVQPVYDKMYETNPSWKELVEMVQAE